jgi:hypothetical protein
MSNPKIKFVVSTPQQNINLNGVNVGQVPFYSNLDVDLIDKFNNPITPLSNGLTGNTLTIEVPTTLDITVTPSLTAVTQNNETITFTEGGADLPLVSRRVYVFDNQGFSNQPNPSIKFFEAGVRTTWVYFYSDSEDLLGYVEINTQVNSAGFVGDIIPNIYASYGLQKNNQGYTGPLVRILRDSDWKEQDFFVGDNGLDVDKVAIQNFINHTSTSSDFTQLPGDVKTPVMAHSICRKVVSSYTGPLIRIRRSSDNSETDIGFDVNGDLDTTAVNTFIGGANAFVPIIYDQSGNGHNYTQITLNLQGQLDIVNLLGGRPKLIMNNIFYTTGNIAVVTKHCSHIMTFNYVEPQTFNLGLVYNFNYPANQIQNWVRYGNANIAKGSGVGNIPLLMYYGSHFTYVGDSNNNNTSTYNALNGNLYNRAFGIVRRKSTSTTSLFGQSILNSYAASTQYAAKIEFQEKLFFDKEMVNEDMLKIKVNTDLYYNTGFNPLTSILNTGTGYVECIYNQATGLGATDPKNQVSGGNADKGVIDLVGVNSKPLIASQGLNPLWYGHEAPQQQFLNQETALSAGFPTSSGNIGLYGGDVGSLIYYLQNSISYWNNSTQQMTGLSNINIQFLGILGARMIDSSITILNFNNQQAQASNAVLKQRFFSSLFGERNGRRWVGKLGSFTIYNNSTDDTTYNTARDILKNNYGINW